MQTFYQNPANALSLFFCFGIGSSASRLRWHPQSLYSYGWVLHGESGGIVSHGIIGIMA